MSENGDECELWSGSSCGNHGSDLPLFPSLVLPFSPPSVGVPSFAR